MIAALVPIIVLNRSVNQTYAGFMNFSSTTRRKLARCFHRQRQAPCNNLKRIPFQTKRLST